jgi:hypothetical protein
VNISGGSQSLLTVYAPLTDLIIGGNSAIWAARSRARRSPQRATPSCTST